MTVAPGILPSASPPSFLARSGSPVNVAEIDVTIPQQILDNWCWAAVTAGLETAFGLQPARTQCRIVTDVLGPNALGIASCCPDGANVQLCNVPHAPQPALGELFDARVEAPHGTSFPFVENEIVQRRLPVLANLGFRDGRVGHLVVISGFRHVGPRVTLIVWDPYTGESSDEPFTQFQRAFRDRGKWRASYRLKRPLPVSPQ